MRQLGDACMKRALSIIIEVTLRRRWWWFTKKGEGRRRRNVIPQICETCLVIFESNHQGLQEFVNN